MAVDAIGKNAACLLAARVAEKLAQFLVLLLVARAVPLETFGAYSLTVYFTALCSIVFDWGLQPYAIRQVAREPSQTTAYYLDGILLKIAYTLGGLLLISVVLMILQYPTAVVQAIAIMLGGRVLLSFAQYNRALFRAHGRTEYEAMTAFAGAASLLAITLVALRELPGVSGLAVAWLASGLLEAGLSFYFIHARILAGPQISVSLSRERLRTMCQGSVPFGLCTVFTLVYFYLDTVMLSKMQSLEVVSRYTAAYNLVFALILFPQVFVDSLFPIFSQRYLVPGKSLAAETTEISRAFLLLIIPLGMGTVVLAKPLIRFFYGERYLSSGGAAGADYALALLIWDACLIFFTYFYGSVLAAMNKQRTVTLIAALGAIFNTVLNLLLIPPFSLVGAAIATVATEAAICALLLWQVRHLILWEPLAISAGQALLGSLVMSVLVWRLSHWLPLLAIVLLGVGIYALASLTTGAVRRENFVAVRRYLF